MMVLVLVESGSDAFKTLPGKIMRITLRPITQAMRGLNVL